MTNLSKNFAEHKIVLASSRLAYYNWPRMTRSAQSGDFLVLAVLALLAFPLRLFCGDFTVYALLRWCEQAVSPHTPFASNLHQ